MKIPKKKPPESTKEIDAITQETEHLLRVVSDPKHRELLETLLKNGKHDAEDGQDLAGESITSLDHVTARFSKVSQSTRPEAGISPPGHNNNTPAGSTGSSKPRDLLETRRKHKTDNPSSELAEVVFDFKNWFSKLNWDGGEDMQICTESLVNDLQQPAFDRNIDEHEIRLVSDPPPGILEMGMSPNKYLRSIGYIEYGDSQALPAIPIVRSSCNKPQNKYGAWYLPISKWKDAADGHLGTQERKSTELDHEGLVTKIEGIFSAILYKKFLESHSKEVPSYLKDVDTEKFDRSIATAKRKTNKDISSIHFTPRYD